MRARSLAIGLIFATTLLSVLTPASTRAASDKELQRLKGVVGYQPVDTPTFTVVAGRYLLPDDYTAVTREKAAALLTLPDSSIIGLGENTQIKVGAFNQTAAGPGSTITVNGGTLRFDVRRPQGAAANYRFNTPTTQIAVRGTVGLLSFVGGNTTVACVACAADSVSVTVGTQTFTLLTGQILTVSALGAVVAGAVTTTALTGFSAAGVSTSASTGAAAATAGVGAAAGTTAALGTTALVGAAAAGAIAAGVSSTKSDNAAPAPSASPIPDRTPSPSPSPTQTQSGSIGLSGQARPTAGPAAAPHAPVAAPTPAPGGVQPGHRGF